MLMPNGSRRRAWSGPSGGCARLFPTLFLPPCCPSLQQGLIETKGIIIDAKNRLVPEGGPRRHQEHLLAGLKPVRRWCPRRGGATPHQVRIEQAAAWRHAADPAPVHAPPDAMVRGLLGHGSRAACAIPPEAEIAPPCSGRPIATPLRGVLPVAPIPPQIGGGKPSGADAVGAG